MRCSQRRRAVAVAVGASRGRRGRVVKRHMITCPHCGALNVATVCFCETCKANVHFTGELRPSTGATEPQQEYRAGVFSHTRAFVISIVHYLLSLGIASSAFTAAWGAAMSDAYHRDDNLGLFSFLLVILQAPVALIQWLVIHSSADGKTGLHIPAIVLLAMLSSLIYGYAVAFLFRSPKPKDHHVA
jgi:hypothetical protein